MDELLEELSGAAADRQRILEAIALLAWVSPRLRSDLRNEAIAAVERLLLREANPRLSSARVCCVVACRDRMRG